MYFFVFFEADAEVVRLRPMSKKRSFRLFRIQCNVDHCLLCGDNVGLVFNFDFNSTQFSLLSLFPCVKPVNLKFSQRLSLLVHGGTVKLLFLHGVACVALALSLSDRLSWLIHYRVRA